MVTEDYPPGEEKTIFRSGDRVLAVGDTSVRGMGPDDFQELLEVSCLITNLGVYTLVITVFLFPSLSPSLTEGDSVQYRDHSEDTASVGEISTASSLPLTGVKSGCIREEAPSPAVRAADAGLHHDESVQPPEHEG